MEPLDEVIHHGWVSLLINDDIVPHDVGSEFGDLSGSDLRGFHSHRLIYHRPGLGTRGAPASPAIDDTAYGPGRSSP
jgi:hypothetical protein